MAASGLVSGQEEPIPLKGVEVEVDVRDHVATVTSTLRYENTEESPIEAVFVFPLPGDAAVCHFSARIGQSEVVSEVKEKQEAHEDYDDALSSGQQAFLLEESEQSPDVFSMSVGSLPPGESASVRLQYVTELAVEADGGLRFCLPAVLNPRYQPRGDSGGSAPPQVTSVPASLVPYGLSFTARVTSPRPISKVESNCSLDPLQYLDAERTQATVCLGDGHKFDRDVELLVYYEDVHRPAAIVEAGEDSAEPGSLMGDPVVMFSLYPEFPKAVMSSLATCGEFLFLMDRSSSMSGERIDTARDTLLLLLKSLPMGCYFNIIGFGSRYDHIFPGSVEYSQTTMDEALEKVLTMSADLGGTEILKPLEHIYKQPCVPNQPRQVFVFTDGEVRNTKEVLELVRRNASSHRCFTFGIGQGASSALITGMAKQGGGHAQFIMGTERLQPKVMQSLRFALQPAAMDISVSWDLPKGVSVTPLSPQITTLFQGQRSLIYAQLTGENPGASEGCVTVKYSLAGQPYVNKLNFGLKPNKGTGLTVHRLGARTLIRSLELEEREGQQGQQKEAVKKRVVELSIQSGVASAFTAFIAVNQGSQQTIRGPLLRRNVSISSGKYHNYSLGSNPMQCFFNGKLEKRLCNPLPRFFDIPDRGLQKNYSLEKLLSNEIQPLFDNDCPQRLFDNDIPDRGLQKNYSLERQLCNEIPYFDNERPQRRSPDRGLRKAAQAIDPLLQVIVLQKAAGFWTIDPKLTNVLGKTQEEVKKSKALPVTEDVWATVLALIWLHGFKMETRDEWQFVAWKAVSWVRAQKVGCITECVEAGKALLGCKLQKVDLGL